MRLLPRVGALAVVGTLAVLTLGAVSWAGGDSFDIGLATQSQEQALDDAAIIGLAAADGGAKVRMKATIGVRGTRVAIGKVSKHVGADLKRFRFRLTDAANEVFAVAAETCSKLRVTLKARISGHASPVSASFSLDPRAGC